MTAADACGRAISLDDGAVRRSWDACVTGFLAHAAATPEHLADTLERAPDFAMGWAAKGLFLSLLARRELDAPARAALAMAERGRATERERVYVEALREMLAGRMFAAAERLDALLARWPGDPLAMKLSHAIRFLLGDAAGMRRSIEAAAPAFGPDHPHAGYAAGCRAFALEETGDYASAERHGRAGLELAPDDAWGLHAVAHVHEMTGRVEDGVRLLAGASARWAHCNNFGYHVWWHLALFHLDRGAFGPALELYDRKIRAERTDDFRDIANAASLLARLEIEGVAVGGRWEELGELCEQRVEDGCNVFADLHYLIALNRSGRVEAGRRLTRRLAADAARGETDMERVAAEAGATAAAGLSAFAEGGHRLAWRRLNEAAERLFRIGGSHAQRDVFARLQVEAAMRGGLWDEAERALDARSRLREGRDRYAERRRAEIAALRRRAAVEARLPEAG